MGDTVTCESQRAVPPSIVEAPPPDAGASGGARCVPDRTGSQACSEVALPTGWEDLTSVIVFARVLLAVTLTAVLGNQLNVMDKDQSIGQQGT